MITSTPPPAPALMTITRGNNIPLTAGTGTLLQATVPNDGNRHQAIVTGYVNVTSAETGGACQVQLTAGGTPVTPSFTGGGSGLGIANGNTQTFTVDPGTTVAIQQSSALTVGAATLTGQITII